MTQKPCDNCTVNVEQAETYGGVEEISCYLTCPAWQRWRKEQNEKHNKK